MTCRLPKFCLDLRILFNCKQWSPPLIDWQSWLLPPPMHANSDPIPVDWRKGNIAKSTVLHIVRLIFPFNHNQTLTKRYTFILLLKDSLTRVSSIGVLKPPPFINLAQTSNFIYREPRLCGSQSKLRCIHCQHLRWPHWCQITLNERYGPIKCHELTSNSFPKCELLATLLISLNEGVNIPKNREALSPTQTQEAAVTNQLFQEVCGASALLQKSSNGQSNFPSSMMV